MATGTTDPMGGLLGPAGERGWMRIAASRTARVVLLAVLLAWAVVTLYPMVFMLFGSLKELQEITVNPYGPPSWPPKFENWAEAWRGGPAGVPLGRYFLNSLVVTAGTLIVLIFSGSLAGYALARYEFPGNWLFHRAFLVALAVPVHALLVPVFVFLRNADLTNNYIGLIGVYSAFWMPFTIIMKRAYFESFPRELEEAARIDGCSDFGVFWRIVFPLSLGAIASIAIINVVGIWSELLFALVIMNGPDTKTLTVGILAFRGQWGVQLSHLIFAALSMASLPTLIFFIVLQRRITKGLTLGAFR